MTATTPDTKEPRAHTEPQGDVGEEDGLGVHTLADPQDEQ